MTAMREAPPADVDLTSPDVFLKGLPHHVWQWMRHNAPVYWQEGNEWFPGFWSITKYDDLIAVSRDPATFISGKGILMFSDPAHPELNQGLDKMMIMTDPPRHVRMRRLVNKGFTPRAVAALEPHVRRITTEIIDSVCERGEADFVVDIAAKLPLAVICDMLGVPQKDAGRMFELTNRTLGADDPEYQVDGMSADQSSMMAQIEMFQYFAGLMLERRAQRKDDLLSTLIDSDIDGEKLTDEEILFFCFLLILAGNETTRNATAGGMLALMEHPDQRARLMADPSLMPLAVDEIVRWVSPVMHFVRVATKDTQIRGQAIKEGQKVLLWYPSANRDEEVFPDGDQFDVGRTPNEHIAFGIGEHFCLGAGLARLELRVIFEELLRRLPDMEVAGPVERLRSNFIGGIKHLPVRYAPTAPMGA